MSVSKSTEQTLSLLVHCVAGSANLVKTSLKQQIGMHSPSHTPCVSQTIWCRDAARSCFLIGNLSDFHCMMIGIIWGPYRSLHLMSECNICINILSLVFLSLFLRWQRGGDVRSISWMTGSWSSLYRWVSPPPTRPQALSFPSPLSLCRLISLQQEKSGILRDSITAEQRKFGQQWVTLHFLDAHLITSHTNKEARMGMLAADLALICSPCRSCASRHRVQS